MNTQAFKLARDTLRIAVKEYGWHRVPRQFPGTNADDLTSQRRYRYGPGKFQGEHWSIVHFYQAMLDGCVDEPLYNGDTVAGDLFSVDDTERAAFQLKADTSFVALWYSDSGFVSLSELTADEYDKLLAEYEQQETSED